MFKFLTEEEDKFLSSAFASAKEKFSCRSFFSHREWRTKKFLSSTERQKSSKLPLLLVLIAIVFNAYTLFPELSIKADPNDNIFQFALVQRANQAISNSGFSLPKMVDYWVPDWASGYPLPLYYQHFPHLFVAAVYKLIGPVLHLSLYSIFKITNYLLWVVFPISLFVSGRWLGLTLLESSLMSFFGSQILTDGLYGMDISSFSFRGYGLSTQLFAIFFAPLALGKIYQVINRTKNPSFAKATAGRQELRIKDGGSRIRSSDFIAAILLLSVTFASHLAIGYQVALFSLFIPISFLQFDKLKNFKFIDNCKLVIENFKKPYILLLIILASCFLLLSYWFAPLLLGNVYHNISFWDPPVKWNSYGMNIIIPMFLNGELFDFSRFPILTILLVVGLLISLFHFEGKYRFLSLSFFLSLALYFGRTTFGSLIDLLPMMGEMHQQRLINGLHLISFPLIGIGAGFLLDNLQFTIYNLQFLKNLQPNIKNFLFKGVFVVCLLTISGFFVYRANYGYLKFNSDILKQSNDLYIKDEADFKKLVEKIKSLPPGRIFAGRPGNWGRQFTIGATQIYLALSREMLEISGFLPESWSLNTDLETFFNEYRQQDYQLYNIKYLVTPSDFKLPDFAKEISVFGKFKLSEVVTTGYFDIGNSNLLVKSGKENIQNIHHLWFISDLPEKKEFPTLWLTGKEPTLPYTTKIEIKGTNLYLREEKEQSLYSLSYPLNPQPKTLGKIITENIGNQRYRAKIEVDNKCLNCLVIFKMTYHPNWVAKVDDQPAEKIMVFPSFMALKVDSGTHDISFEYKPDPIKLPLMIFGFISLAVVIFLSKHLQK